MLEVKAKHCTSLKWENLKSNQNKLPTQLMKETDTSNVNVDISKLCNNLLADLESDLTNLNFSGKAVLSSNEDNIQPKVQRMNKYDMDDNNKQVGYIKKVKMVELSDLKSTNVAGDKSTDSDESYSISKPIKDNHEEYIDSLIMMIEKAAKDLCV